MKARLKFLGVLMAWLTLAACSPTREELSGIWGGAVTAPDGTVVEQRLQLFTDSGFLLAETAGTDSAKTAWSTGTWRIDRSVVILAIPGEKDRRYDYLHGMLRDGAASSGHPSLPDDRLGLYRFSP